MLGPLDAGIGNTIYERAVMLDTSPLVALFDQADARQADVRGKLLTLQQAQIPVFITHIIMAETHARILQRFGIQSAASFLDTISDGSVNIVATEHIDLRKAREIIARFPDQDISLADATTMAVMLRMGILNVLTFDHHYWLLNFRPI